MVSAQKPVSEVDPFLGTGGHGHTHPAATAPFGMVQLGPDTRKTGWDGCSGYHYSDSTLYGFSHTHLSGTGVPDYCDILFKPLLSTDSASVSARLAFAKKDESAQAGYYRVKLKNGVLCEMTATSRTGIQRYTFPKGEKALLLLDLNYRDELLDADFAADSPTTFHGKRYSRGWARNQKVHFAGKANLPFEIIQGDTSNTWILDFGIIDQPLEIQIGLSGVSPEGAERNRVAEAEPFDEACKKTTNSWQNELDRIQVWGGSDSSRTIFATALYHAFSVPNLWSDVDGRYRGMDDSIHRDTLHNHYTVFSLWDTYRAAHPLYALVQKERTEDFIATMLDQFDQSGRLPVWELAANETDCMIAYHSVSVLADAVAKGYTVDPDRVLHAMDSTANAHVFGLDAYKKYGYLSIQDESESVSKTLEYAYDDGCIGWTAERFGKPEMAKRYFKRATGYRSVIDPKTGLVRPRDNGGFLKDTNPSEVNPHFTEANAWQYSFAPVQDLEGWMLQLGIGNLENGRKRLENNLDSLFLQPEATTGRTQKDITGLIGQYAHGNEPSHHVAFLYNTTASPWKAQERVAEILSKFYRATPDGLVGNEDCGQMSAWYIMASMGLYPLVPGQPDYVLTTPIWDSLRIALPNGKNLKMICSGTGSYIDHLTVNGVEHQNNWISHQELMKGGTWQFFRSANSTEWGSKQPYMTSLHSDLAPAPIIDAPIRFTDIALIRIETPHLPIYSLHTWTDSGADFGLKSDTIKLTQTDIIYATFRTGSEEGHLGHASVFKKPNAWQAKLTKGIPNSMYAAGGAGALVDGIVGNADWRKGDWMGFQNQDVEIALENPKDIHASKVRVHLLKDIGAWIALPAEVTLEYLKDSDWISLGSRDLSDMALINTERGTYSVEWSLDKSVTTNRFRVLLTNPGKLPEWHPGAGGESFIFIDEVSIQ